MEKNYIGVDLHNAFFQACAIDRAGTRVWEGRFERNAAGMARWAAHGVAGAGVAVEASGPTWALVDAIQAHDVDVCVVDTRKTKIKAGDAAKTDKLDARRLADAVRRESVVSLYIPPPAIRELRELVRGRHHLVRVRAKLMQSIKALRRRQDAGGPPVTRLVSVRGLAWLQPQALPGAGCRGPRPGGGRSHCRRAHHADGDWPGGRLDAAGRDRHHRALCALARAGQLRGAGQRRRRQRTTPSLRSDYAPRIAVAALGVGGGRDSCDEAPGCHRPLGPTAGGPDQRVSGARRTRAGLCVATSCGCGAPSRRDVLSPGAGRDDA